MFIGREKELVLLQQDYIGKAVMVYGKRRVGKTTLIQKALDTIQLNIYKFRCTLLQYDNCSIERLQT